MPWKSKVHSPLSEAQRRQIAKIRHSVQTPGDRLHNNRRSRDYSRLFLSAHPLCVECERQGRVKASEVWDHIVPHQGDEEKYWDPLNHQALCRRCHSKKTARGDGGFGNPRTGAT